ncbi:MAG: peptidoglycan synthetase [Bacteroidetes bacterium]|nr:peptidoglycan synthetase [Bacteroidota bacterium]MBU1485775.1 peptidoglycan synthetase [Bacteroidota bacterium]MBU2269598.1 peptidoglycan synthetase [Bacteroidota bacterium]MBU2376284.1 peptidoglycan synthetase [Bacteroidota bacterium]
MRVHFIAIGGAAMHNLAIALHLKGFNVTGSDDVIYEPSKTRLRNYQILPEEEGWNPENITSEIDAIILGMHARIDNPELTKAQELKIPIYSYPEYIYEQSKNKKRVVIGGSHGKTTITSMILHVLNFYKRDFDYLVGAQIEGFDNMVRISDAPVIVIEGDEYLASPIDKRPKFHLYKANTAVISGIAWDHINVFPTFELYQKQFNLFIDTIQADGKLIYCQEDEVLKTLVDAHQIKSNIELLPYGIPDFEISDGKTQLMTSFGSFELNIFGKHNLMNLNAARLVCEDLEISSIDFYGAIKSFKGAARRLEKLGESKSATFFKDFAHSPSKLKATIDAVKEQFPDRKLIACIELHTFSSLNEEFLLEYAHTMNGADFAIIFIDEKTFLQKKMKPFSERKVIEAFKRKDLKFFNHPEKIKSYLQTFQFDNINLLMMSSGNFGGINLVEFTQLLLSK